MLRVTPLTGDDLAAALPDVARLRIEVFRAYPYLYEGDAAYEEWYLSDFAKAEGAIVVAAYDGPRIVGAATGAPMEGQMTEWAAPFLARGQALEEIFYCGESVLSPEYRGQGVGHAFFDHREAQAQALGRRWSCFCAVIRPDDHPVKPVGYRPLDGFWRKRGYAPLPGVEAEFSWKELGEAEETSKRLQFWMRELD